MAVIFVSSSIPQGFFPTVDSWVWAKLVHLVYFGVLALLIQQALRYQTRWQLLWKYLQLASILLAVFYGASEEVHQMFTVGRHARVSDVMIDALGATLFILGSMAIRSLVPKKVGAEE